MIYTEVTFSLSYCSGEIVCVCVCAPVCASKTQADVLGEGRMEGHHIVYASVNI